MPQDRLLNALRQDQPAPRPDRLLTALRQPSVADVAEPEQASGSVWGMVGGAALLAGGAYLASKTGLRAPALKLAQKVGGTANAARQQLMLSGYALPKSVLGNVGAAGTQSIERGSTKPLRELFSRQTLQDAKTAYKAGTPEAAAYGQTLKVWGKELPTPGRLMGALDNATQKALQRAGLTADEAQAATLQTPLGGQLGDALDSPTARYLIPFRRTPFNQFFEGLKTFKGENLRNPRKLATLGIAGAAGAAHGAATADDRYPLSIGLGSAAAAKYGLPYTAAAFLGRMAAGGTTDAGIMGTVLPVSEYGLTSGLADPLGAFTKPAFNRLLGR